MRKILIALAGTGIAMTAPILPVDQEYLVRTLPNNESQFEVKSALDIDVSSLKKTHVTGTACYNEFRAPNKKTIREQIVCEQYEQYAKEKPPVKKGYTWIAYQTLSFDTPSGDLDKEFYYVNKKYNSSFGEKLFREIIPKAEAAIALDGTSNSANNVSVVTSYSWSHTVTDATDGVLWAAVYLDDGSDSDRNVSSITYNGSAMTHVTPDADFSLEGIKTLSYYLVSPSTGANTIQVSLAGFNNYVYGVGVSLTGVDGTNTIDASNSATQSDATSISYTLTTIVDNAWILDTNNLEYGGTTFIFCEPTAGQTEIVDTPASAQTNRWCAGREGPIASAGNQTISWGCSGVSCNTDRDWASVAVSFTPAGAGGGGATSTAHDVIWFNF